MATNTNPRASYRQDQSGSEQPSYPGGSHQPWDDTKGLPSAGTPDNGRDYDSNDDTYNDHDSGRTNHDNDQGYDSDRRSPDQSDRQRDSLAGLRDAENSAVSNREPSYRNGSQKPSSYYTGNGRDASAPSKAKGKKRRGLGAIITIAIILTGGAAFLSSSNSLLIGALSALTTSSTQTSYTSYALRTKFITSGMLRNSGGGAVTTGWTGRLKYAKIPTYLQTRLANYGINVEGSGSSTRLSWTHTTSSGVTETISDIDANTFLNMYNDNIEFRESYTRAKRGRVATFFDNVANKIYQKLGISRNLFSRYKQTGDYDTDVSSYKSTMEPKFEGTSSTVRTNAEGERRNPDGTPVYQTKPDGSLELDADGNPIPIIDDATSSGSSTTGSSNDIESAKTQAGSMIANVASTVAMVGNTACTILKVGNMIAITVAANEIYQSINYFMGLMENVSKTQAGYGDASAVNTFFNFLSTPQETSVEDYSSVLAIDLSGSSTTSIPEETVKGSPLESAGLRAMLAGVTGTAATANSGNYSLERVIRAMGGAAAFGATTVGVCAGISAAQSILSIATAIATGGASVITGFFSKTIINLVTAGVITAALSFIIPTVAKVLFTNVFDTAVGIPAGELLARGAAAANMREGRSGSGQSISDDNAAIAFNHATNEVLALEAEQDRANLSPFDISNRNTFFGSIAYSLLPIITTSSTNSLASLLKSTSSSFSTILGGVSAEGAGTSYVTTFGDCPLLNEIGAVGDMYCNPIVTTDMSTIEMEPTNSAYVDAISDGMVSGSCDSNGDGCTIDPDKDLAKYITFCDGRDSPFGVVDQNILGSLEKGNVVLNSLPLVGDVLSLINAGITVENIPWANGERCGNTADNSSFWNSKGKYYQRYIEDQRILEQMGAYEGSKNPVVAYEEAYEAEYLETHPEANTYIGYLSRISGLTPTNTETVLAFVAYYTFVDSYDPATRVADRDEAHKSMTAAEIAAEIRSNHIYFDNNEHIDNPLETNAAHREYIAYFDLRNRSRTV